MFAKFNPGWLTARVVRLAEGMLDSGDLSDMPVFVEALIEAGCIDPHRLEVFRSGHSLDQRHALAYSIDQPWRLPYLFMVPLDQLSTAAKDLIEAWIVHGPDKQALLALIGAPDMEQWQKLEPALGILPDPEQVEVVVRLVGQQKDWLKVFEQSGWMRKMKPYLINRNREGEERKPWRWYLNDQDQWAPVYDVSDEKEVREAMLRRKRARDNPLTLDQHEAQQRYYSMPARDYPTPLHGRTLGNRDSGRIHG